MNPAAEKPIDTISLDGPADVDAAVAGDRQAFTTLSRPAVTLSCLVAALATLASAGGLLIDGLYTDNEFVTSTWKGNDLVTLAVATPLLTIATGMAARGSLRARLVWIGMLDYMLYNAGFYLFGAAFNRFFFIYAGLFGLAIWALVFALGTLDTEEVACRFDPRTPVRRIAIFMIFVGSGLTIVYFAQWLLFAIDGDLPSVITMTGHPTNVVFALDLSLVVPVLIVGALLLWRREPWGFVLAAMVNVKGAVYMLALCAATVTAFRAGTVDKLSEIALWGSIGTGSLLAVLAQLRRLNGHPGRQSPTLHVDSNLTTRPAAGAR